VIAAAVSSSISLFTAGRQPPHMRPARLASATWRSEHAPSRTALRMVRSVTAWQWHTIMTAAEHINLENEVQCRCCRSFAGSSFIIFFQRL
jgi:hypothetical protein